MIEQHPFFDLGILALLSTFKENNVIKRKDIY